MYKIKINSKTYYVNSISLRDALQKVGMYREMYDAERASPMTYKKLREKGYGPDDWKDWSKSEKEERSRDNTQTTQTERKSADTPQVSKNKQAVNAAKQERPLAIQEPGAKELHEKIKYGNITEDEIVNSPIIKAKSAQLNKLLGDIDPETKIGSNETININTPERQALRQEIAEEMVNRGALRIVRDENGKKHETYDVPVKKGYRAEIVIGRPAGGKSSVIVNRVSEHTNSRILDSDEVKKELPEFKKYGGDVAGLVHKESADIILEKMIIPQFGKGGAHEGDNIVIPIVGKKPKAALRYLKMLKEAGYEVHLSYNDVSPINSMKRATSRYLEEGRFLDPAYIQSIGDGPENTYKYFKEQAKTDPVHFDSFSRYNNNVEFGQPAEKVERLDGNGNKLDWEDWQ